MLFATSDISGVPDDIFKYIMITLAWLVTTGAAIYGGARWSKKGTKESPVSIEQPLDVRKHDAPAKKSEHDSLKEVVERIDRSLSGFLLKKAEDDLAWSEQLNAQFNKMATDGQARAVAIAQSINENVEALNEKNARLAVHVADHAARIINLEKADDRHEGAVTRIQTQIAQMLSAKKSS